MNKFIVSLIMCAQCLLGIAHAAENQWVWQSAKGYLFDGTGSKTSYASGTAYLYDSTEVTPNALLSKYLSGETVTSLAIPDTGAVLNSVGKAYKNFDYKEGAYSFDAYFAVIMGNRIFLSETKSASHDGGVGLSQIAFAVPGEASVRLPDESGTYTGKGWYAAPEPTTWAMVLAGLTVMALCSRRRLPKA